MTPRPRLHLGAGGDCSGPLWLLRGGHSAAPGRGVHIPAWRQARHCCTALLLDPLSERCGPPAERGQPACHPAQQHGQLCAVRGDIPQHAGTRTTPRSPARLRHHGTPVAVSGVRTARGTPPRAWSTPCSPQHLQHARRLRQPARCCTPLAGAAGWPGLARCAGAYLVRCARSNTPGSRRRARQAAGAGVAATHALLHRMRAPAWACCCSGMPSWPSELCAGCPCAVQTLQQAWTRLLCAARCAAPAEGSRLLLLLLSPPPTLARAAQQPPACWALMPWAPAGRQRLQTPTCIACTGAGAAAAEDLAGKQRTHPAYQRPLRVSGQAVSVPEPAEERHRPLCSGALPHTSRSRCCWGVRQSSSLAASGTCSLPAQRLPAPARTDCRSLACTQACKQVSLTRCSG